MKSPATTVLACLTLGLLVGVSCTILSHTWFARTDVSVPTRPAGVPLTSRWAGGSTGGNWFDCRPLADAKYDCAVYADVTGVRLEAGTYRVVAESSTGELRPTFLVSDGNIELTGAHLVRIER